MSCPRLGIAAFFLMASLVLPAQDREGLGEDGIRMEIVQQALSWLGTPYRYGGASRDGTDCSGFVRSALLAAGVELVPRTSAALASFGIAVPGQPWPGDVVLFSEDGEVMHAGICVGGNEFAHAASQGRVTGVIVSSLDEDWFAARYSGARNVLASGEKK